MTLRCITAALLLESALSFVPCSVVNRLKNDAFFIKHAAQPTKFSISCVQDARDVSVHDSGKRGWAFDSASVGGCQQYQHCRIGPAGVLLAATASEGGAETMTKSNGSTAQSAAEKLESGPSAAVKAIQYNGDFLFEQKIESVKAALLCGAVGSAARLLAVGAGAIAPPVVRDALGAPEPAASSVLFGLASGFAQGVLFGLTYRYVVRADRSMESDTNARHTPQMDGFTVGHLGDGCVAAFALTSALGQSEVPLTLAAGEFLGIFGRGGGLLEALSAVLVPILPFLPRAAGDLLLYSATRAAIDRALDEKAIKPFP